MFHDVLPRRTKDGKLVLPKGSIQFVDLTTVIAGHYKACKENDAQLKLFNVPSRMAMRESASTSETSWELESVDVVPQGDANVVSLLRDAAPCQRLDMLLSNEPSMVVQKTRQRARQDASCVEVREQADEPPQPILDEYDILCNDRADDEATDASLADITADEEAALQKSTSSVLREASREGSALAQAPGTKSGKIINTVVSHLKNTHGDTTGLTDAELEEEAIVLVMRSMKKDSSYDDYVGQVAQSLASATEASSASAGHGRRTVDSQRQRHGFLPSGDEATDTGGSAAASEHNSSDGGGGDSEQSVDTRNRFLAKWVAAFNSTAEALLDRSNRCQQPLGYQDEVALLLSVAKPGESQEPAQIDEYQLLFVKWDNPDTRTGRSVRVDKNFRIVYSPPVLFGKEVPRQKFAEQDFCCLINACGAASRKSRGTGGFLRDQLPPTVIRFARLVGLHSAWKTKDAWLGSV